MGCVRNAARLDGDHDVSLAGWWAPSSSCSPPAWRGHDDSWASKVMFLLETAARILSGENNMGSAMKTMKLTAR